MNMRAFGYCRVSTDDQAAEGVSMDAQRSKITAYASLHDHELVEIAEDPGVSGKAMKNRPELRRLLERVAPSTGGSDNILVVYSLSRLSRNVRDLLDISHRLQKSGAQIASITEHIDTTTAPGRLFFTIMAALADFERDQISERTKAALSHKRERGQIIGNTPYGFMALPDHDMVLPDEVELKTLRVMLDLAECDRGPKYIADALNARGMRPRSGGLWNRGVVARIVQAHRNGEQSPLFAQHGVDMGGPLLRRTRAPHNQPQGERP